MGSIADLFVKLALDDSGFAKDVALSAQKAGDAGGKTLSTGLSSGIKAGAKLLAVGMGALFGIATKGAVDLEAAQAKFTAETGLTGKAAEDAGHAIAEMSKGNLQNISTIGDVLIGVTKNMGLTGDAANAATQQILNFATATGQDATEATKSFDDVLDSWHKTAADMPGIMDQLIAGTQRFGGTVQGAEAAVVALAPAIQGLGGDFRDATGFVNLFETAGLDASSAAKGLQTALKSLKPGQSLDDLIKQVASIEDPTKRAQEAMRIFGVRSGAGLANALQPGITSLDQFNVSALDAAGATVKAADAIKGQFTNQLKLAIQNYVTTPLAELGQTFGPLATGMASVTLLLPGLTGGLKALGLSASLALAPFGLMAAGAAAIVAGSAAFVLAMKSMTDQMGTADTKAAAWNATLHQNTLELMGNAGAARASVDIQSGLWKRSAGDLLIMRTAWAQMGDTIDFNTASIDQAVHDLKVNMGWTDAEIAALRATADKATQTGIVQPWTDTVNTMDDINRMIMRGATNTQQDVAAALVKGAPAINTAARHGFGYISNAAADAAASAVRAITNLGPSLHDAIESGKGAVKAAMADLMWELKHPMAKSEYEDWLKDKLEKANRARNKALKSGNAEAVTDAQNLVDAIKAELDSLRGTLTMNAVVTVDYRSRGSKNPRMLAGGGHVDAFETVGVGEHGREWFMPDRPGTIIPDDMAAAGSMSGELHLYVHDPDGGLARAGVSTSGLARELQPALRDFRLASLMPTRRRS